MLGVGLMDDAAIVAGAVRWLTVRQPWADLIMAGVKTVENRGRPVPSTLPQWWKCQRCGRRFGPKEEAAARSDVCMVTHGGVALDHKLTDDGPFLFTLGIHAAKTFDVDSFPWLDQEQGHWYFDLDDGAGAIVGQFMRPVDDRNGWVWYPHPDYRESRPLPLGVLLGTVDVVGQHHADNCESQSCEHGPDKKCFAPCGPIRWCSPWAQPNRWHYELAAPRPLSAPVPWKGRQGWWRIDPQEVTS